MAATSPIFHQAGVIAYRIRDGKVRVLLMTSRDTGRWIIPRGNIKPGVTPCRAAEQEAYEEAGVRGTIIGSSPLGMYTYSKELASGEARAATVEVYLLRVKQRLKKWPERRERKLSWVSTKEAVRLVEEPGVVPLLRQFMESSTSWQIRRVNLCLNHDPEAVPDQCDPANGDMSRVPVSGTVKPSLP